MYNIKFISRNGEKNKITLEILKSHILRIYYLWIILLENLKIFLKILSLYNKINCWDSSNFLITISLI
ncbi:hypothetical protein C923_02385 [Plasmodium falciparum UGT5.1]|uniref:Uncharacterized protein n=3 Tax=Plasmodium falciparum TaxID=5833 RepID=W7JZ84_PLAFA|nr:hypothetical protein PFFVO_02303 [Plasmodium falciparum Vietnam Oak-Knoll (FVO)]ETW42951.1 hypothetical protein PFNF135_02426 [Plasmodium falciparum NF135/5.C10]EWC76951.1 hypothetical protein C923_02385 [Plasmodium falciparum UGT5.1]